MAYDIEHEFLCTLLINRDWSVVLDHNINEEYFDDPGHGEVFAALWRHYAEYGVVMSREMVKTTFPTYKVYVPAEPVEFLLDKLREKRLYGLIQDVMVDVQGHMTDREPGPALEVLTTRLGEMQSLSTRLTDVDLTATWEPRLEEYVEARKNKGHMRGLPTGFESIDRACLGLQPQQLIYLVGLPKAGKTTIIMGIAAHVHRHEEGHRVLVVSFEMSGLEIAARFDATISHVSHHDMLSGRLSYDAEQALRRAGEEHDARPVKHEFIVASDPTSSTTIGGIAAKIEQHRPDLCIVDGIYLMDDEYGESKNSPQALTNISRGLKRLAQRYNIPIIGTTQVLASKVERKKGITMNSIGYSSAFQQDADLILAVEKNEDDPSMQYLRSIASRVGPNVDCEVSWDWETMTFEEAVNPFDKAEREKEDAAKEAAMVAPEEEPAPEPARTRTRLRRPDRRKSA